MLRAIPLIVVAWIAPLVSRADEPDRPRPQEVRRQAADDLRKMQGTWARVDSEVNGTRRVSETWTASYEGDLLTLKADGELHGQGIVTLDPGQSPRAINTWNLVGPSKDATYVGIYEFDGDEMRVCFARPGNARPTKFETGTPEGGSICYTYTRVKR